MFAMVLDQAVTHVTLSQSDLEANSLSYPGVVSSKIHIFSGIHIKTSHASQSLNNIPKKAYGIITTRHQPESRPIASK